MFIKGTAVKSTRDFLKINFSKEFDSWINSLPESAKLIYKDLIISTKWYSVHESIIIPTKTAAKLFFNGDEQKTSYEIGKQSAKIAFESVYKQLVEDVSFKDIVNRSDLIFETYYSGVKMDYDISNDVVKYIFTGLKIEEELLAFRLAGSIETLYSYAIDNLQKVECKISNLNKENILIEILVKLKTIDTKSMIKGISFNY